MRIPLFPAPATAGRPVGGFAVGRRVRRGFSLVEVLVVIAILAFLLAILLPSLDQAKVQVRRVMCKNNLRQWGAALQYYRDDHNDFLPTEGTYLPGGIQKPYTWYNVLPPYLDAPPYKDVEGVGISIKEFPALHVWICPAKNLTQFNVSGSGKNQFHYGMNEVIDGTGPQPNGGPTTPGFPDEGELPVNVGRLKKACATVYLFDIFPNSPHGAPDSVAAEFHRDSANVLYVDGGVANFRARDFVVDGDWEDGDIIWRHPRLFWGYLPPMP